MIDPMEIRFFKALQDVVSQEETPDSGLRAAIDRAVETATARDMVHAREAVDALDSAARDRILQQVHARMATDISAIWGSLPAAPKAQRPN